jgi:hypothetical protein
MIINKLSVVVPHHRADIRKSLLSVQIDASSVPDQNWNSSNPSALSFYLLPYFIGHKTGQHCGEGW